jgi:hypothetical protein
VGRAAIEDFAVHSEAPAQILDEPNPEHVVVGGDEEDGPCRAHAPYPEAPEPGAEGRA